MTTYAGALFVDERFYVTDRHLQDQTSTIDYSRSPNSHLHVGVGAAAINTPAGFEYGKADIVVEICEHEPAASVELWDGVEESSYATQQGLQQVRDTFLEEGVGDLAVPMTQPGPAIVHLRVHWVHREHPDPGHLSLRYLMQMWTTATEMV